MNELLKEIQNYNIRKDAGSSFYQRGEKYSEKLSLNLLEVNDREAYLLVTGSQVYDVHFELELRDIDYECDCPAFDDYGVRKHVVAAFLY